MEKLVKCVELKGISDYKRAHLNLHMKDYNNYYISYQTSVI